MRCRVERRQYEHALSGGMTTCGCLALARRTRTVVRSDTWCYLLPLSLSKRSCAPSNRNAHWLTMLQQWRNMQTQDTYLPQPLLLTRGLRLISLLALQPPGVEEYAGPKQDWRYLLAHLVSLRQGSLLAQRQKSVKTRTAASRAAAATPALSCGSNVCASKARVRVGERGFGLAQRTQSATTARRGDSCRLRCEREPSERWLFLKSWHVLSQRAGARQVPPGACAAKQRCCLIQ